MATWEVLCDVVAVKGNKNISFPELDILKQNLIFDENKTISLQSSAQATAVKQFSNFLGYKFMSIDRIDKKTGKDYSGLIGIYPDEQLKVKLNQKQIELLESIQEDILGRIFQNTNELEGRLLGFGFIYHIQEVKKEMSIIKRNHDGKIATHDVFQSIKNFYDKTAAEEIDVLNIRPNDSNISINKYEKLKQYYESTY